MDRDTVINVTGLGKRYTIGHRGEPGGTLRDAIARSAGALMRATGDMLRGRPLIPGDDLEEIWALRGLDFDVRRGEVLGIIGRNGAGKSTLLKLLSRITDPTEGRIEIRGRVASLLEVGTGFHFELTGRENVFLNGAIMGMSRAEIRRKFDEIVAFAGVEQFLDTPVKRYSSGMYVRLAFAVAAHLEPEILIVDEVLAVGDAEFQKKCLGKMHDVAGEGRTVLFVSHQLGLVTNLCDRAILLADGRAAFEGDTQAVVERYVALSSAPVRAQLADAALLDAVPAAVLHVEPTDADGSPAAEFRCDEAVCLRLDLRIRNAGAGVRIGIGIDNGSGVRVATWDRPLSDLIDETTGDHSLTIEVAAGYLAPGPYAFAIAVWDAGGAIHQQEDAVCRFTVHNIGAEMSGVHNHRYGAVILPAVWRSQDKGGKGRGDR